MAKRVTIVLALVLLALVSVGFFGPGAGGLARPSAGPDVGGKIAYVKNGAVWIYQDGESRRITAEPTEGDIWRAAFPAFSPDGAFLTFTMYDEGFSDLILIDLYNPDEQEALTRNRPRAETGGAGYADQALWALHSAWSPDGTRLAFTTDVGTQYPGLFALDPNSPRKPALATRINTRLDFSQQTLERPTWSPDGSRIAVTNYSGTRNGKGQIWSLNLETSRWTELTDSEDGAYDPAWSPDGAWIAFTMRKGNKHDIYMVPTDAELWTGTHPTPIQITTDPKSNARTPAWSPEGNKIAYLSLRDGSFDVMVGDLEPDSLGNLKLKSVSRITENAHLDGAAGLAWAP